MATWQPDYVCYFYPRSPYGERPEADGIVDVIGEFLSTLSLRRATPAVRTSGYCSLYFYPRSPCGERPKLLPYQFASIPISIHALLAESDNSAFANKSIESGFLSTLSLRRATVHGLSHADDRGISIHALLAESDIVGTSQVFQRIAKPFLSTLSLRRAT